MVLKVERGVFDRGRKVLLARCGQDGMRHKLTRPYNIDCTSQMLIKNKKVELRSSKNASVNKNHADKDFK